MKNHKCPRCNSEDINHDSTRGEYTCKRCGIVLEENAVVSELTFADSNVTGKFGSQSGDYTQMKMLIGYSKNSKDARIAKVHKQIHQLASNLKLSNYQADSAKRLFNLAHHRGFTQGRHTSHVIAAAIYIVCRQEKTPHLLIDISDALQINLYVLGACYLKFVKLLHMELPLIDPSLFIHRFCAKLEFGDKTQQVSITALRLLQRMKRDWMSYGRRPNSLCGAAILIAAKYHGFKRTINQIVQTVHVCDETIRKRLEEFKRTSVASLTREEFERIDLEKDLKDELDPPSFKRALESKEYIKITNYEKELQIQAELIESQLHKGDSLDQENPNKQASIEKEILFSKSLNGEEETYSPYKTQLSQLGADYSKYDSLELVSNTQSAKKNGLIEMKPEKKGTFEDYSETLSDVDDSDIQQFLLTPEESAIKSILWHHIHKEWIEEQSIKIESNTEKKAATKKRKRKMKEIIDAPNPIIALSKSSKLGNRLDYNELSNLFDEKIIKKLKTDD